MTPEADDAVLDGAAVIAFTALDAALDAAVRSSLQTQRAERPLGATRITLEA